MATFTVLPVETNRPGTQLLEITLLAIDGGPSVTVTFPKRFRVAPRILSWVQTQTGAIDPILRFSAVSATGLTAEITNPIDSDSVYTILVLGELAPS
jgi:hypothetical protein